jgi:hypothetical protein
MSIQCDDEITLQMLESGERVQGSKQRVNQTDSFYIPEEALACLAEHSCEYLGDKLAFSLISDQHRKVVVDILTKVSRGAASHMRSLLELPNFAEYFTNWSLIRLFSPPSFTSDVPSSRTSLSFFCKGCRSLIITQNEVESPHYHGGHGPAFLAHCVFNCHHSANEAYETQFTTGVYRVCDVSCLKCGSRVGKKYIEARDPANYFKVGKILLEQTLLTMPKCCNNRKLNAFPPEHYYCSREAGVSCFCSVCLSEVRSNIATAVLAMTNNLERSLTMKLYSILQAERQAFTGGGSLSSSNGSIDDYSPSSLGSPQSSISRRFGDAISRFVRKSLSPCSSGTSTDLVEPLSIDQLASAPAQFIIGDPGGDWSRCRLSDDQLVIISHCVGERLGMIRESQNWIVTTKFLNDLISATSRQSMLVTQTGGVGIHLCRPIVIEALVGQCEGVSFPSITLLLSRLANVEDRRAVVSGIVKNESSRISEDEVNSLRQLAGWTTPQAGRWSR